MRMPKAPDPYATAQAQSQMNRETAISQAGLNAMNQYGPDGSLEYSQIGTWSDGTPRFAVTQKYSTNNQALYDLNNQTDQNLAQIGVEQSKRMGQLLGNPISFASLGGVPNAPGVGGPVQTFANPEAILVDRQQIAENKELEGRLIELGSRRLSPELQRRRLDLDATLADKGIKGGSDAYSRAMSDNSQAENDAWTSLILNGQGQAFNQAATRASNDFNQDLQRTGQYVSQGQTSAQNNWMQALGQRQQMFQEEQANYQNQLRSRQQTIDEMLAERSTPINELTALMSGAQVSKPSWTSTPQTSIQPTDLIGLVNNQFNAKMGAYNGLLSGLGSIAGRLGGAAIGKWG